MKVYNKLVRDKIPEIIKASNKDLEIRTLNDEEYISALNTKLKEELNEYLESGEVEELADLEEVLRAILDYKKINYNDFENIRLNKVNKRGAFKNKIMLISTSD